MAQEARVRDDYRLGAVTAFGGREFVKGAWRHVPDEQMGSAAAHPFLEVREAGVVEEADEVDVPASPPARPTDGDETKGDEAKPPPRRGKQR